MGILFISTINFRVKCLQMLGMMPCSTFSILDCEVILRLRVTHPVLYFPPFRYHTPVSIFKSNVIDVHTVLPLSQIFSPLPSLFCPPTQCFGSLISSSINTTLLSTLYTPVYTCVWELCSTTSTSEKEVYLTQAYLTLTQMA